MFIVISYCDKLAAKFAAKFSGQFTHIKDVKVQFPHNACLSIDCKHPETPEEQFQLPPHERTAEAEICDKRITTIRFVIGDCDIWIDTL